MVLLRHRPQGQVAEQVRAAGSKVKGHPGPLPEGDTKQAENENDVHQSMEEPVSPEPDWKPVAPGSRAAAAAGT